MTSHTDHSDNTFWHTVLESNASDMSNNPRSTFANYIVNSLNNDINSNLMMLPMTNRRYRHNAVRRAIGSSQNTLYQIQDIINRTLLQKKSYKQVLSEKGEKQLKRVLFKNDDFTDKECAISMEEFKEGQMVIQLPCSHIFDPESIKTWLKEESAKCPVCRFKLEFKEVKDTDEIHNDNNDDDDDEEMPPLVPIPDISQNNHIIPDHQVQYNQMFNNMQLLYNPLQAISSRPQRSNLVSQRDLVERILNIENEYIENRQIQRAIMESFNESNTTENVNNITHADGEELNELNFDAMNDDNMMLEDLEDDL